MNGKLLHALIFTAIGMTGTQASAAIGSADIGVIMDESGSMSGEQRFIGGAMQDLDLGLNNTGVTNNLFSLVGFGSRTVDPIGIDESGRGNNNPMSSTDFDTATDNLVLNGSTEDGYDGIDFFFDQYPFRAGAATNVILVTDEDRDVYNNGVNKPAVQQLLSDNNALLNAVVNASFACADGSSALGIDASGNGFQADGSGGFSVCTGGVYGSGAGTTLNDYVDVALTSGGAAWDLNQLRAGGNTATSFANAFIDVKVTEITEEVGEPSKVPAPAPLGLLSAGLLGLAAMQWHKHGRRC